MNNFFAQLTRRKFLLTAGASAVGSLTLKGCQPNSQSTQSTQSPTATQTTEPIAANDEAALYEAAKKEGQLVYYTVFFTQEIVDEIGAAFSKKYPGIQFQGTRKVAGALFQQLNQELQAGQKNCDVFGTTDLGQMVKLSQQQLLMQYEPAGKENMRAEFTKLDPQNFYQTGSLIPIVIGYNTEKIKTEELPKDWKELIDPKYKDMIATGSGAASGQVGTWALAMEQKFGWDNYFSKFNSLNPKLGRSINDVIPDLVSGERALGIVTLGQILTAKAKGNPVDVVYPAEGAVILVGPIGILKDAPHANAAKLFMNFMMSREYSELVARYFEQPLRSDVKGNGTRAFSEMNPIIIPPQQIEAGIPEIKTKWKEMFGA
jgi:iron(III) transport system substrate-binding protein